MEEALALLRSRPFNVVLVGEHQPEVKSEEILKALQSLRTIRCIVLQRTTCDPAEAEHLLTLGAYAVLPKQRVNELLEKLRQSLQDRRRASKAA